MWNVLGRRETHKGFERKPEGNILLEDRDLGIRIILKWMLK
jgi:hypothetical protein